MTNIALSLLACAVALGSATALAQSGTVDTYCGTPVYGAADDVQPDAPTIDGLVVTRSTNVAVQKVVARFGKHTLEFSYGDAPHIRRTAAAVSAYFRKNQSKREVCFDGEAIEYSTWGTPIVVAPGSLLK